MVISLRYSLILISHKTGEAVRREKKKIARILFCISNSTIAGSKCVLFKKIPILYNSVPFLYF